MGFLELPEDVERHVNSTIHLAVFEVIVSDDQQDDLLFLLVFDESEGMSLDFEPVGSLWIREAGVSEW